MENISPIKLTTKGQILAYVTWVSFGIAAEGSFEVFMKNMSVSFPLTSIKENDMKQELSTLF